jgi:hypothetical protein
MLLGHGLQRTNTASSAPSVKENAEKKKKSQPFATCSSNTDGKCIKAYLYHSINKNIPILCDASRSRTAENQHH